jgi:hypothetical protein
LKISAEYGKINYLRKKKKNRKGGMYYEKEKGRNARFFTDYVPRRKQTVWKEKAYRF